MLMDHSETDIATPYGHGSAKCNAKAHGATKNVVRKDKKESLVWGCLPDGSFLRVDDAPKGRSCGAACPICGDPLIARKGKVREWHYAHASGAECATAAETAIHLIGKSILESGNLLLPKWKYHGQWGTFEIHAATEHKILSCVQEHPIHGLVLDAFLSLETRKGPVPIAAEIKVTHACGESKATALRSGGLSAIEIDLSGVERDASLETIERMVRRDAPRSWVYLKGEDRARERGKKEDENERRKIADKELNTWTERKKKAANGTLWRNTADVNPKLRHDPAAPAFLALAETGVFDKIDGAHIFKAPPKYIASTLLMTILSAGRKSPDGELFDPCNHYGNFFKSATILDHLIEPACKAAWESLGKDRLCERGEKAPDQLSLFCEFYAIMEPCLSG